MELPQLTPAQIGEALKGTEYEGNRNWEMCSPMELDAELNAARAILLARENERLREALNSIANSGPIDGAIYSPYGDLLSYGHVARDKAREALAQTETQGKNVE